MFPDDWVWISWIDREGAIFSSGFSFFENLPLMLVLLLVLQRFGRRQWGYISELTTDNHSVLLHPVNPDGTLGEDKIRVNFYPDDKIHSSWTLLDRATTVVGANRNEEGNSGTTEGEHAKVHDGDGVASGKGPDDMQGSQGDAGKDVGRVRDDDEAGDRTTGTDRGYSVDNEVGEMTGGEYAYLRAHDDYREASDKIIEMHNLVLKVSWPESSRLEEWRIIGHAQALGRDNKFIRGHIPEVKYGQDLDRYSTRHIRRFLGLEPDGCSGTRALRLIVMDRLRPIHDLDGEWFWKTFWQCVGCKYALHIVPPNLRPCFP